MPVKNLIEAFNRLAGGAAQCSKAFLEHGRPAAWVGREAQRLVFEGRYSTGASFQIDSGWIKPDADLDQAVAAVVAKILETPS
jgi:hypothetical protein